MRGVRFLAGLMMVVAGTAVVPAAIAPAPAAAATRGSVLMVGDSTMRGMSASAQNIIRAGYDLTFDSGSCRRLIVASCKPIPNALAVIRANPGRDVIVVMTGYNDWKVGDAVEAIMAEAGRQGVSYVVWLTYRTDIVEGAQRPIAISDVFRDHNRELAAKAPLHPTLRVLDWDGYSAGRNDWFAWDKFHLSTAGGFALADLLKRTMDGLPLGRCKPEVAAGTRTAPPANLAPSSAPPAGLTIGTSRRLLDTRAEDGDGVVAPLGTQRSLSLMVTGAGVPSDATSVLVNLAAVDPCGSGFLTAYPCGSVPLASNVNFLRGRTVANLAAVRLDSSGRLCVYTSTQTDVLVDLVGAFGSGGWRYNPVKPARLVDTRDATGAALPQVGPLPVLRPLAVPVHSRLGVPADAKAVAINVTAVAPPSSGYLAAYPCGPVPGVSTLNFAAGQVVANLAVVRLAADGTVCFFANSAAHLVIDVVGWWGETGARFAAATPRRLLDTRDGAAAPLAPGGEVSVGAGDGKLLNVTAVAPAASGFLTAYPCGPARPWVSSLNYGPQQIVPNVAPVAPGRGDRACVYLQQAGHVVIDQLGTFVP